MDISVETRATRITVKCAGRLDVASARTFEETVGALVRESRRPIVLDFSRLQYISSAGIRSLLFLMKTAASCSLSGPSRTLLPLRLAQAGPAVRQVLELSGLLDNFSTGVRPAADRPAASGRTGGELLPLLRDAFPSPVSDADADARFVASIAEGLGRIDRLKTGRPYLGLRDPVDYSQARRKQIPEQMSGIAESVAAIAEYMQGGFIWSHPHTQENVVPPTTVPAVIANLLGAIYNPNIIWDEYSYRVGLAEIETAAMCASLVGYDPDQAAGFCTFGGTGTILYGVKLGVEKACPGAFSRGVSEPLKLVASSAAHYAKFNVLGWLGIGTDHLVTIPTDTDNSMDPAALEDGLRRILDRGEKIAAIIATMGTTDAFGIDNLQYIVGLRDRLAQEYRLPYLPHIHADAVIGWAWSVFNDYDFDANPLGFNARTLRCLWDTQVNMSALGRADSVGLDFHKTGFGPYVSSMILCKNKDDLGRISRDTGVMPYLFQFGHYHPGVFTLETSRSGGSVLAALANLKLFGKEGYRALLGHLVTMAEVLRRRLDEHPAMCQVNDYNYGPVTLFRAYPDGVNANEAFSDELCNPQAAQSLRQSNAYNQKLFDELHRQMEQEEGFALSLTSHYRTAACGEPVLALKSFVMSPFVEEKHMQALIACIEKARLAIGRTA
ncbi:MAG: STAS domain-containing protein [Deltaproteobacteria bacterium]|jgi:anti-anti-sigma factor|nr:STAS domain-containing protein [Syntrophaceae bacterium]